MTISHTAFVGNVLFLVTFQLFLWSFMALAHVPDGGETSLFKNSIYGCIRASAILSVVYDTGYCVTRGKLGVGGFHK